MKKDRFVLTGKEGNPLGSGLRLVFTDEETGVQYLFVQSGYAGGLTVLVDADGRPLRAAGFKAADDDRS